MDDEIFEKSSGNVFEDLGLKDAREMQAKTDLAFTILDIFKDKKITQTAAAELLKTHQSQISRLKSGSGVKSLSFDILLKWLTILEYDITVSIKKVGTKEYHLGEI